MGKTAFELTPDYAGHRDEDETIPVFEGGVLGLANGESFDVGAQLNAGDGVIVVEESDETLVELLRSYEALRETDVPEGYDENVDLAGLTNHQLRQRASMQGIEVKKSATKAELVAALSGAGDQGEGEASDDSAGDGGEG